MNVCEICGADFPNITELYRHKNSAHNKSLVLFNHKPEKSLDVVPYMSDSQPDLNLKRKRDDIDSQNVKRYRALPEPSRTPVPAVRPRRKKPKRTFRQVEASTPEMQVAPIDQATPKADELEGRPFQAPKPVLQAMDKYTKNEIAQPISANDFKTDYEKCTAELRAQEESFKQQISKIKKECGHDILKIKKKFKKRELALKKEITIQKKHYEEKTKEMEEFHEKNTRFLEEKIKSLEQDSSLKPLSDAIFNCITVEEIFKIKKLLKEHKIEELIENHLDTLQKLFLSLSYGVIPICQPQRDIISDYQKNLIGKIETSTPEQAKELVSDNRMEIINLFSIIDQSIKLATDSYRKFVKT